MSDCAQCGEPPCTCRCGLLDDSALSAWDWTLAYLTHAQAVAGATGMGRTVPAKATTYDIGEIA